MLRDDSRALFRVRSAFVSLLTRKIFEYFPFFVIKLVGEKGLSSMDSDTDPFAFRLKLIKQLMITAWFMVKWNFYMSTSIVPIVLYANF